MADRIDPLSPEPPEPPLDGDLLDAWQPPAPSLDFADRVVAMAEAPKRRRSVAATRGLPAAAAILIGIALGLRMTPSPGPAPEAITATPSLSPTLSSPAAAPLGLDARRGVEADEAAVGDTARVRLKRNVGGPAGPFDADGLPPERFNGHVSFEVEAGDLAGESEGPEPILRADQVEVDEQPSPAEADEAAIEATY